MEIFSDSSNENYCKLCGMLLDETGVIKKIKGRINYFCCNLCVEKYFAFKFNKHGG
jgi:YHS domain-containing protein